MNQIVLIVLIANLMSCINSDREKQKYLKLNHDKIQSQTNTNIDVDTTTLEGQRKYIKCQYSQVYYHSDTLVDLNYDGFKDYMIVYDRGTGTGAKNMAAVYFYDPAQKKYIVEDTFYRLSNPTFYLHKKKITVFYIGHGSGNGVEYQWMNNCWTVTKQFQVENKNNQTIWELTFPLSNTKKQVIHPFQPFPPDEILETNISMSKQVLFVD